MKHVLIQERKSLFLFLRYLLLLFVMPTELIAQSITISGTVTDSNKEAVIGANVLLKGTSTGTITDVEGKYQLTVPEMEHWFFFCGIYFPRNSSKQTSDNKCHFKR